MAGVCDLCVYLVYLLVCLFVLDIFKMNGFDVEGSIEDRMDFVGLVEARTMTRSLSRVQDIIDMIRLKGAV